MLDRLFYNRRWIVFRSKDLRRKHGTAHLCECWWTIASNGGCSYIKYDRDEFIQPTLATARLRSQMHLTDQGFDFLIIIYTRTKVAVRVEKGGGYFIKVGVVVEIQFVCLRGSSHFLLLAPPNCLQYHLGTNGFIRSFNNGMDGSGQLNSIGVIGSRQIASLEYNICIRRQKGMCSIFYTRVSLTLFQCN